jgi:phospholipid transport system transporter-binding protein
MASLEKLNETDFVLRGDLVFKTTNAVYEENLAFFKAVKSSINISLEGVEHVDSSGLALIVDWFRMVKKNKHYLNVTNMPQQMSDLAKLSSVDELLFNSSSNQSSNK